MSRLHATKQLLSILALPAVPEPEPEPGADADADADLSLYKVVPADAGSADATTMSSRQVRMPSYTARCGNCGSLAVLGRVL